MKGLLSKVGDKVGVTNKAKAPSDDVEYNEICKQLASYTSDVKDLGTKLDNLLKTANNLAGDAEKAASSSDKIANSSGLGRSTDVGKIRPALAEFKDKVDRSKADVTSLLAELKALQTHIDERHKAGADMQSLKKKAETLESKNDAKAGVARSEADRAEEAYNSKHDSSLNELKEWKDKSGSRFSNLFDEVEQIANFFFRN